MTLLALIAGDSVPRCLACFGHELLPVLLSHGNHKLINAHRPNVSQHHSRSTRPTLARVMDRNTIATFLPKKFFISDALTALGH